MTLLERGGEAVMEDTDGELRKHMPIWIAAHGRVLVTGLGLGCVVRALLAKPEVEHVDVVEIDLDILRVVGSEFEDNPRVTLHHSDALAFQASGQTWDFAWHDIHTRGDSFVLELHGALIRAFAPYVERQGAWGFPRACARWVSREIGQRLLGVRRVKAPGLRASLTIGH